MDDARQDGLRDPVQAGSGDTRAPNPLGETLVAPAPPSSGSGEAASSRRWSAERMPVVAREGYEIDGEIARGGIGRILRGRSVHLDRLVAIKELLDGTSASAERFVGEALLTARLQHPSIVPVYEAGRWPTGELFYAMKLVTGRSLADVVAEPRSTDGRLALLPHVLAVAEAMAYAHSERIIHRDLKPANVLVGAFGETVVIDWGLAKDLADGAAPAPVEEAPPAGATSERASGHSSGNRAWLTMEGAVMGTPMYMPPEQAAGLPVDARADVYAIGAILYHALAGAPPYPDESARAVLRAVLEGPPPPLESRDPGISRELCTIVRKAMAREPTERYPSARELAEDLRRFATGQLIAAHAYTHVELVYRFVRRWRASLAVATAALVALSVAIGVGFHRTAAAKARAEQEKVAADVARAEATRRADDLTLVQARASAAQEPDRALGWLASLSPSFSQWSAARMIAADAAAHGLATVLRGHAEAINAVQFSPDGKLLASASDDRTVRLWDLATGRSEVLAGHTDEAWGVLFPPGGKRVVTASKDKTIRLWDLPARTSRVLTGHEGGVVAVALLDDGRRLVSGGHDGSLRLWDLPGGEERILGRHPETIAALAATRDGRRIVSASHDGNVRLWDVERGELALLGTLPRTVCAAALSPDGAFAAVSTYAEHVVLFDVAHRTSRVLHQAVAAAMVTNGVAFSPDGRALAFSNGGVPSLVDPATGAVRAFDAHGGRASTFAFSSDGRRLAAGNYNGTVDVWDLATGVGRTLHGFGDVVVSLTFSPDGRTLAAGSSDHSVRLFPVETSESLMLAVQRDALDLAMVSPAGDLLATAERGGVLRFWDLGAKAAEPTTMAALGVSVLHGDWSPDGALLATISADATLRLWDRSGNVVHAFPCGDAPRVGGFAFSPSSDAIAWIGRDGRARVADVDTGVERALGEPFGPTMGIAFSPDGGTLAVSSRTGPIEVITLATGAVRVLRGHEDWSLVLAFSPDGTSLVSGALDHTIRIWDLATGAHRTINAGGGGIERLAYSPDGAILFSLSRTESGVRLWDPQTGETRGFLRGHEGGAFEFVISPDGTRLATAGADHTARLWDLATGESRVLRGHTAAVTGVAFSPDGRAVLSVSIDGTVRLWPDDLPSQPEALRSWLESALRRASPQP